MQIRKKFLQTVVPALLVSLQGCGGSSGGSAANPPAPPVSPPPPPPPPFVTNTTFTDVTASSGVSHIFSLTGLGPVSEPAEMGGGIAAADIDDDGDIDLYLVGGDGDRNKLYRNNGGNSFTDIAQATGLDLEHRGSGPAFADIDGDNDLDLFIGSVDGHAYYLFRNDAGIFSDVTANSGILITAVDTISGTFSDYDLDGDLDLFVTHWGNLEQMDTESLWQNNGDGTFTSASIQSGIAAQLVTPAPGVPDNIDFSFAAVFSDIDGDRDPDVLLASDFSTSKVFSNNRDGTFTDTTDRNVIIDRNGMGNAVGDYDNDGDMDWFVTSIYEDAADDDANFGNRLYRNRGDGTFEDVTDAAGVANGGWGWASCMEDFDNDGDLDIFHVNGWNRDNPRGPGGNETYRTDQIRYFENQGNGHFVAAATEAGLTDTGQGRGAACFDADRDGDLDIVIANNQSDSSVVYYRNELVAGNNYLTIKLAGSGINTDAIGAWIEVDDGTSVRVREIRAGNNFVSQSPAEAHFGLGGAAVVDVTVTWPGGGQTSMTGVAANQLLIVVQQ